MGLRTSLRFSALCNTTYKCYTCYDSITLIYICAHIIICCHTLFLRLHTHTHAAHSAEVEAGREQCVHFIRIELLTICCRQPCFRDVTMQCNHVQLPAYCYRSCSPLLRGVTLMSMIGTLMVTTHCKEAQAHPHINAHLNTDNPMHLHVNADFEYVTSITDFGEVMSCPNNTVIFIGIQPAPADASSATLPARRRRSATTAPHTFVSCRVTGWYMHFAPEFDESTSCETNSKTARSLCQPGATDCDTTVGFNCGGDDEVCTSRGLASASPPHRSKPALPPHHHPCLTTSTHPFQMATCCVPRQSTWKRTSTTMRRRSLAH